MATKLQERYLATPSLWSSYRHELFKNSKQRVYSLTIVIPLFLTLLVCLIQTIIKLNSHISPTMPPAMNPPRLDFGTTGTFAWANSLWLTLLLYNIVTVGVSSMAIANEYQWHTIKTLISRQPNRVRFVLSKCLFVASLVAAVSLSFVVCWCIYGLFLKFYFNQPFEISGDDWEAIGKGLSYYGISCIQTLILALAATTLTFLFKSAQAGFLTYVVYNSLDGFLSLMGANVVNKGHAEVTGFLGFLMDLVAWINPFLLNSNISRLTQQPVYSTGVYMNGTFQEQLVKNDTVVFTTAVWWAWAVLAVYILGFCALSVWLFVKRDITD
jgi:ABC-type transport system involved in multi-copper enzyme maturation permease subunit